MEHNIQACLNFLLAKGVSVQDIQAKEIREGNLKAILGLFFQLSRYKQQQKMLQQQPTGKNSTLLFTFEHVVMFIYRHGSLFITQLPKTTKYAETKKNCRTIIWFHLAIAK